MENQLTLYFSDIFKDLSKRVLKGYEFLAKVPLSSPP